MTNDPEIESKNNYFHIQNKFAFRVYDFLVWARYIYVIYMWQMIISD